MDFSFARRAVVATVGHVSWQPPGWLRALFAALNAHRRAAALCVAAILAAFGGRYAYTHRKLPPKPLSPDIVRVKIISAPAVPALEDKLHIPDLTLYFSASAAALALVDHPVPPDAVRLEPALPGEWRWDGDKRLQFQPTQPWPPAQTYRVTIGPAALGPRVKLADYQLETRTPDFTGKIDHAEFYQDPKDPNARKVTATLVFSHAVDAGELERRLSVTMLGGSPVFGPYSPPKVFTLSPGRHGREWFLCTVPLTLPKETDTMKLRLADGLPAAQGSAHLPKELTETVKVPDLYSVFRVESADTRIVKDKDGNPEQFLFVETTCALKSEDFAKALEVYALPRVNPAHAKDKDDEKSDDADADKKGDSDDDEEDEGNSSRSPAGNHDGRFHDDSEEDRTKEGTETADVLDGDKAPDPWAADEVDADTLKKSKRVTLTLVPSHDEQTTTHTFRLRADRSGSLFVRVAKNTPAPGGYLLREDFTGVRDVPVPAREITIRGEGGVLALSGERKLSIQSRGIPAIRFEVARVPVAEINHLITQTYGDFQKPEFHGDRFNEQDLARFTVETQPIHLRNPVEANYSTFDFTGHLKPVAADGLGTEGLFFLSACAWDPKTNKYVMSAKDSEDKGKDIQDERFILVTDLGLLVKRNADESRDVFVASLATGAPLGGVEVSILARSGATLATAPTDVTGRASLPGLGKNPHDSREPVAIVARRAGDVSFLPYSRKDRALDFSRFPIEGTVTHSANELEAFVFTERGVYRPGDTLHIGTMVKQRDWNGKLDGLPLETEVIDAEDHAVETKEITLPASGFFEWTYETAHESPTGGYTLNVYVHRDGKRGTLLGSATAQVKEFLPDRLKLDVALSRKSGPGGHGWVTPDELSGKVVLKNLYGTAASDRKIKAHLRLNPREFAFKEFPGYTFFDRLRAPRKDWEGETIELGDKQTDGDGAAAFDLDLKRFADVTYRMTFDAEGFEAEGGRSVEDLDSTLVSPLPYVVGTHADGDLNWIPANGAGRVVEFIGVNPALERVALPGLTLHLAEQTYVSVLTKESNGNYHYESVRREKGLHDEPATVPLEGWKYTLPSDTPGNFVAELRDAAGLSVSRVEYTVVGQGQVSRSLEKNAELEIKLSKEQYAAGDEIEVAITAPYAGSGLITLEREKVFTHVWFKSTGTSSVQKIKIPADFNGTGYVNVSLIRALGSKEIFMSPLSYAAAPFTANMERRRLGVELHAAEKTKPGEPLAIRYRTDSPAKIAVFAVDQGILQVTRFPLPDPLAYQFRKSALTVRTSQIVDLLLPEFSLLRSAQATGGDGNGDPGVLNPFRRVTEKPVVYWAGIVDADTTERTLTYNVPDYFNGTLKIMAVAVSPDRVGSAKTSTLCRNAFVLTPGLPTLAAPGDEFEVGLTVANGQTGSGPDARVTVQAEPAAGLQIVRGPTEPLHIPEGKEASTTFRVRALDKLGSAQMGFRASAGSEDTRVHATISIRPAMPFRTVVQSGNFRGPSKDVPVNGSAYYNERRKLEATVSAVPLGLARGLERYLKEYPHGCSEQVTSSAFARLALADEADFGLTRAEAAEQIARVIGIDRQRQNDAGGFGFWSAGKTPDIDFVTAYVMHFLSEAKAGGYEVPEDMFKKGLEALRRASTATPHDLSEARVQAYAIYVLTRESVVTTNSLLTLRDYLDTHHKDQWRGDLTAAYMAGSWALLKKDDEARKLIAGYRIGQHDARIGWWDFYQPLGADAQYVTILARHFPDLLHRLPPREFEHVTRPIGDGDFSTLSAAYAVLALKAYAQAVAHDPAQLRVFSLVPTGGKETPVALEGKTTTLLRGTFPPSANALRFRADGGANTGVGVFFQTVQSGFERAVPAKASAAGIEVFRELLDADGKKPVTQVRLGDRVTVRLRLRSTGARIVTNVAVLDLLPGGFEVADDSLKPGTGTAGMDYVDVREDRAVFYGTLTNQMHEITYKLKPTSRGEFVVPPVFAEGMYDKKIQSLGLGGHISVVEKK